MGLVLDSGVLIAAEREARPVSRLLLALEQEHGETEILLSSISVIELEHGFHRANTADVARKRAGESPAGRAQRVSRIPFPSTHW